jgi:hypothetical protein
MTEGFALSCFTENEALLFGENNSRDESHRSNKISVENEFPGDVFGFLCYGTKTEALRCVRLGQNKHDI